MVLEPGATEGGPDNAHRGSDQWLYVLSGSGRATIGGRRQDLKAGTLVLIERGVTHEIRNAGADAAQDPQPVRAARLFGFGAAASPRPALTGGVRLQNGSGPRAQSHPNSAEAPWRRRKNQRLGRAVGNTVRRRARASRARCAAEEGHPHARQGRARRQGEEPEAGDRDRAVGGPEEGRQGSAEEEIVEEEAGVRAGGRTVRRATGRREVHALPACPPYFPRQLNHRRRARPSPAASGRSSACSSRTAPASA